MNLGHMLVSDFDARYRLADDLVRVAERCPDQRTRDDLAAIARRMLGELQTTLRAVRAMMEDR